MLNSQSIWRRTCTMLATTCLIAVPLASPANDDMREAAETAEVFIYGHEAQYEDVLREISDPDAYEAMAKDRADTAGDMNENIRIKSIEITDVDGDTATAKATYSGIHNRRQSKQRDVHLKRVDGRWQVTNAPKAEGE